jgi:hypothetical protein
MGQFKPMVKMMTTEPSVELKLKKGGSVKSMTKMKSGGDATDHKKMASGGAMAALSGTPALVGRPAVNAPVRSPGKPSMASRRKAMAAKPKAMPATPMMKKGGSTKKLEKEIRNESEEIGRVKAKLTKHEDMAASKAHKGLKTGGKACATGGVALGNGGGYKKGGDVKKYAKGGLTGNGVISVATSAKGAEGYKNTKMKTAEYTGKSSGKTGGVKNGNAGGYATGGVALGQGGYKDGGKAKKAYAAGGTVDSGHPVAMPQGRKKPSTPVSINQLSGTFKKGGKVTPAQGRLQKVFDKENAPAMKAAKAKSLDIYSKYQKKADGGKVEDMSKGAYDRHYANEKAENEAMREAMMGLPKRAMDSIKGMFSKTPKAPKGMGAVTETEKSLTVTPAKKRGGAC